MARRSYQLVLVDAAGTEKEGADTSADEQKVARGRGGSPTRWRIFPGSPPRSESKPLVSLSNSQPRQFPGRSTSKSAKKAISKAGGDGGSMEVSGSRRGAFGVHATGQPAHVHVPEGMPVTCPNRHALKEGETTNIVNCQACSREILPKLVCYYCTRSYLTGNVPHRVRCQCDFHLCTQCHAEPTGRAAWAVDMGVAPCPGW